VFGKFTFAHKIALEIKGDNKDDETT